MWASFIGREDILRAKAGIMWGISGMGWGFPRVGFILLFCPYMGFSDVLGCHILHGKG
jgi:hypothetical protein